MAPLVILLGDLMNKPLFSACAFVALVLPHLASAQQGYIWNYERYISDDVFQTSLSVAHGVPETDDQQFWANCAIGANHTYAVATLAGDIGTLQSAAPAEVTFVTDSGYSQSFTGEVVRDEEFIHGIEFAVETSDGFWDALTSMGALGYRISGHEIAWLNGEGSGPAIHAFVSDCANIGDLTPETGGDAATGGYSKG